MTARKWKKCDFMHKNFKKSFENERKIERRSFDTERERERRAAEKLSASKKVKKWINLIARVRYIFKGYKKRLYPTRAKRLTSWIDHLFKNEFVKYTLSVV